MAGCQYIPATTLLVTEGACNRRTFSEDHNKKGKMNQKGEAMNLRGNSLMVDRKTLWLTGQTRKDVDRKVPWLTGQEE